MKALFQLSNLTMDSTSRLDLDSAGSLSFTKSHGIIRGPSSLKQQSSIQVESSILDVYSNVNAFANASLFLGTESVFNMNKGDLILQEFSNLKVEIGGTLSLKGTGSLIARDNVLMRSLVEESFTWMRKCFCRTTLFFPLILTAL